MSVLIKGMEMPSSCYDCSLCYDDMECSAAPAIKFYGDELERFDFCTQRAPDCPLINHVDVKPLMGWWGKYGNTSYFFCSCCCVSEKKFAFCPNCGAIMMEK